MTTRTFTSFGIAASICGNKSACTTIALAAESRRICSVSSARKCQLIGTAWPPRRPTATVTSKNGKSLRNINATESPGPIPSSSKPVDKRLARANSSSRLSSRSPLMIKPFVMIPYPYPRGFPPARLLEPENALIDDHVAILILCLE